MFEILVLCNEFIIIRTFLCLLADDDNESTKIAYYVSDDKSSKSPIEIEDEQVYNISDRIYDKINYCLICFV